MQNRNEILICKYDPPSKHRRLSSFSTRRKRVPGDLERLAKAAALAGADRAVILCWTREPVVAQNRASTNLAGLLKLLMRS